MCIIDIIGVCSTVAVYNYYHLLCLCLILEYHIPENIIDEMNEILVG